MTDAYVSIDVTNSTEAAATYQNGEDNIKVNTNDDTCLTDSLITNLEHHCNETNDTKVETKIQSNISSNYTKNDNVTNSTNNVQNKLTVNVTEADPNTVLKYVYKKNEVKNVYNKTSGHPKNTLRRRKRSESFEILDETKAPLIVNYETSHAPLRDVEVWLPARNTSNIIKNSALADFNIETLHYNEPHKKKINGPSTETITENTDDINESVERENYKNNNAKSNVNSEESNEQNTESLENSDENDQYPRNNEKYSDPRENYKNQNTNNERDQNSSIEVENEDVKNSKEDGESEEYDKSKHNISPSRAGESVENSSEESEKPNISYPNSDERSNSEEDSNSKYKGHPPGKIQGVDLGEYERMQVNENDKVDSARDVHENTAFDPARDVILLTKPNKNINTNEKISSLSRDNTDSSSLESHDHTEPTHINDGEVRPVVEINSEVDSAEASDENPNEDLIPTLENESLETLTGVNEKDDSEKSDKLQESNKSHDQGDLKQQFERIPLNYNHADKKQSKDSTVEDKEQTKDTDNAEETIDKKKSRYDANLNIKFDDLTIKLPEIKLPDDILSYEYENPTVYYKDEHDEKHLNYHDTPNKNKDEQDKQTQYQDTFQYNKNEDEQREQPTYYQDPPTYNKIKDVQVENPAYYRKVTDEKQKPRFYHYSDEVEEEPPGQIKQEQDNDKPNDNRNDYYGYYSDGKKNEAYKKKQNNDQKEEDLYEKFVRERFGKRGTFEKRSEKLTNYKTQNPHLYETVQNILKKTKDVQSEADKSGDPKAGYMWTLEYGEKL